ncbi:hypothetical protein AB0H71_13895 [Nocardia sp. NPDC050697]|uniref:hypothetical protein n=1 Tax=Nocardia sp. NPDC050697 TaxID=3155158 RepID=UPI0033DB9FEC
MSARDLVRRSDIAARLDLSTARQRMIRRCEDEGYKEMWMRGYEAALDELSEYVTARLNSTPQAVLPITDPESHSCTCPFGSPPCSHCTDCETCNAEEVEP